MSVQTFLPNLRIALIVDAAVSAAAGLLMVAGSGLLARVLGLPEPLLVYAGLALAPFVLFVAWLAMSERPAVGAVWAVIAMNVIWVAASALLLLVGGLAPTPLGYAFVIVQAVVVFAFAEIQFLALRRSSPTRLA